MKLTSETAIKAKDQESKNTSIIEKQMSDLQVNNQVEAQTGTIMRYNGDKDGMWSVQKYGLYLQISPIDIDVLYIFGPKTGILFDIFWKFWLLNK